MVDTISRMDFIKIMNHIQSGYQDRAKIDRFLSDMTNDDVSSNICEGWISSVILLLNKSLQLEERDTMISWWISAPGNQKRMIYTSKETGKEVNADVTTPGQLYDAIVAWLIDRKSNGGARL